MKKVKVMQITLKNGIHIQIGVESFDKFKEKKNDILGCGDDFIDIIETCTFRVSEVVCVEYFEKELTEDEVG